MWNWSTLVVGGVGLISNLLVTAYFYGGLSREVKNHGDRLEKIDGKDQRQDEALRDVEVDVGRIKGHLKLNGGYYHGD